ncbi:SAM-dependent methyltransferase [Mycolicibacterium pulveris]|uniref:S-adenosyl-L-methionine-dependent methyltransferase n=1 Tax=Mycolicibacterium pulveris TaxID=36813 RepID=A0A7I7UGC6_MYCPV|nr:SAM-dependent methyltransferase [Mycolicibacterium pulveris]MCV6980872.1 SAM-dependent methyltransferase [Mycolicibacterium pulveris]BBY80544.1 putative S-adenosyl-L-methionine-dependent methyltransferase [Mycolicibacterium pulveris]
MGRADDDGRHDTEGVDQTELGVAWLRAQESDSGCPLFTDPYAQMFLDAAEARGWQLPPTHVMDRIRSIADYAASRTKWFDEFFIAAGAYGIEQMVILAAGLDSRAWRLPWVEETVVYEIDRPDVLAFKAETLRANDVQPGARYVQVAVDLQQDWPKALRDAGFDDTEPLALAAEGLLSDLPAEGRDLLFERVQELSVSGSRVAVESFGAGRREQRSDVPRWLTEHGWEVTTTTAADLMDRYGRCGPDQPDLTTPRTEFIDARLVC